MHARSASADHEEPLPGVLYANATCDWATAAALGDTSMKRTGFAS
jgi:hypothetical protein